MAGAKCQKSTETYWNRLLSENKILWNPVGMEGVAEETALAIDEENGAYTRLTRFVPGADSYSFAPKGHDYPEKMIIQGRFFDAAFEAWLEFGDYAGRHSRGCGRPI